MKTFRTITYPDLNEVIKKAKKNPEKLSVYAIEYLVSCEMIKEANELRRLADKTQSSDRRDYHLDSWRSFSLETAAGKCKIRYPRLRGFSIRQKTEEISLDLLEEFKEDIARIYVAGDSDRDIAFDLKEAGITLSKSSVSRYYREVEEKKMDLFENQDLKNRSFLCLQVDAMYVEACLPAAVHPEYKQVALVRVLGLAVETRCFECLSLIPLPNESITGYRIVFDILEDQNIGAVFLLGSDFHLAFDSSIYSSFIGTQKQGCRFHAQGVLFRNSDSDEEKDFSLQTFRAVHGITTEEKDVPSENFKPSDSLLAKIGEYSIRTSAYKEYPEVFSKEISTTNQDERSNEEMRRRFDPIHASPSVESNLLLAYSVTQKEAQTWYKKPKGSKEEMREAVLKHESLLMKLYEKAEYYMHFFPDLQTDPLEPDEFVALWVHLYVLPIVFNPDKSSTDEIVMTLGFLSVRGVRADRSSQIVALIPLKDTLEESFRDCAESLIERGLREESIKLIIQNRPNRKMSRAFLKTFKEADLFMEPTSLLERMNYLTWGESVFEKMIEDDFKAIYSAEDFTEAKNRLKKLKSDLKEHDLTIPLDYFEHFGGDSIVNVFKMIDSGVWKSFNFEDFEYLHRWEKMTVGFYNKPEDLIKTVKRAKKSLRRKIPTPS